MTSMQAQAVHDASGEALRRFNEEWRRFEAGEGSSVPAATPAYPVERQQAIDTLIDALELARHLVAALRSPAAAPGSGSEPQADLEELKALVKSTGDLLAGAQHGLETVREESNRLEP